MNKVDTELLSFFSEIQAAQQRIKPFIPTTPISDSFSISEETGKTVRLKWDNKLRTGSFKERGALNFLLSMTPEERAQGVIAASAGNHALGVSYYAQKLGVPCHLIMPVNAPLVKVGSCRSFGAKIIFRPTLQDAIISAKESAQQDNLTYLPPYDHLFTTKLHSWP